MDGSELVEPVVPKSRVGVTLVPDGGARTVAASDEPSVDIDQLRYDLNEGPCLHGLREGEVVVVDEMREETRWAPFPIERSWPSSCTTRCPRARSSTRPSGF